jgi:hypothetical protein
MNPIHVFLTAAAVCFAPFLTHAQSNSGSVLTVPHTPGFDPQATSDTANYSSNVVVVRAAQEQALEQARQMLEQDQNTANRAALEKAVREMEQSRAMLEQARTTPAKLPAALAAQQAAYEALLKILPREFRITRSRGGGQGFGAGQPTPRELDQLEMTDEANRYETERQATAPPDLQQRARTQTADRLKQLAQRQQDLNDRLRELQTALSEARTDQQREEARRQLKRLQDEERRMLADLDELRQRLAPSSATDALAETQQQLDRTRSDVQRAAEELARDSASGALAAGTRAQESLQQLREELRRNSSSRFSEQMRQMRTQARDLAGREDELARQLESFANAEHKTLDDSAQRQELTRQLARQQSALTNLLSDIRTVTEQAESTEPLLSQQLYDALRRADQARTDNLLESTAQLLDRGFIPQAGEAEHSARQNIHQLRQSIERAAESVLGNEAEALRYAQKELEDLTRQVSREIAGAQTNSLSPAAAANHPDTNSVAPRQAGGGPDESGRGQARNEPARDTPPRGQAPTEPGRDALPRVPADRQVGPAGGAEPAPDAAENGGRADRDRLRQLVERLGSAAGQDAAAGGPITGNNYVNWADRMREVEQVLDSADLRNQLATVRERVGVFRGYYREYGHPPQTEVVRTQILVPMTQVRVWLQQEIARLEDANSLVPLDRDPVPENFSELVRRYYEKLGSGQPQ